MDINAKDIERAAELTALLTAPDGVSGREDRVVSVACELLKKFTDDIRITDGGSVTAVIKDGSPMVVLDAHSDQVGFVVTDILDGGFLCFSEVGGIDARILPAQQVVIHGKKDIKGVICSVPPHLKSSGSKADTEDMYIDTGLDRSTAEKYISRGDTVSFFSPSARMIGSRMTGGALDDRCGMAAILIALEKTDIPALGCGLTVVFASQEEVGMRGAECSAYDTDADIAIAVDVSFGLAKGEKKQKCGIMGKGVMIGYSPTLDRGISEKLTGIAESLSIPYQVEVMSSRTGTNADKYSLSRGGARTSTLSVPLRYMHTPSETIDLRDVVSAAELISAYLKEDDLYGA